MSSLNKEIELISSITKDILFTTDIDEILEKVPNSVTKVLDLFGCIIFLREKNYIYTKAISDSIQTRIAKKVIGEGNFKNTMRIDLNASNNLVVKSFLERKSYESRDLSAFTIGVINPTITKIAQFLTFTGSIRVSPIQYNNESIGVLLTSKIFGRGSHQHEADLINLYADHLGIAIKNSILHRDNQKVIKSLKDAYSGLKAIDNLKDEIIDVTAHELRTPITIVRNSIAMMSISKDLEQMSTKFKEYFEMAKRNTARAVSLVEDTLIVSRIEGGRLKMHFECVEIHEFIEGIVKDIRVLLKGKNRRFDYEQYLKDKIMINIDKERITEVINNLVTNAIKYSNEGDSIKLNLSLLNDKVCIKVIDSGIGIPKEDQKKLFKKFGRTEGSYIKVGEQGGTGLGLYISKRIMDMHNGEITLESKPNEGSSFTLHFPIKTC